MRFLRFLPPILVFAAAGLVMSMNREGPPRKPMKLPEWLVWVRWEDASGYSQKSPSVISAYASPLESLFSFDFTSARLGSRWQTRSASSAGHSCRWVALTDAQAPAGLVGELSYDFATSGRLERIMFKGSTTDPGALADLAAETFGFIPSAAPAGEVLLVGEKTFGGRLHLRSSKNPETPVQVDLEIERAIPSATARKSLRETFGQSPATTGAAGPRSTSPRRL